MSKLLKPCPFCGEKVTFTYMLASDESWRYMMIECCLVVTKRFGYGINVTPKAKAEKHLASLWNRRF